MKIPYFRLDTINAGIEKEIFEAFRSFFSSHFYILGTAVKKFEQEYAAFSHTDYCIGISNGLDALIIALESLNIEKGAHIIVPSNTYIATVLAVLRCGHVPVFAEPNTTTYNINPEEVRRLISDKTKAIIPVHLYGQACEMTSIMDLAEANGLYVVEDNAQAHGASFKGKITGSFGHINAVSFYPGKNLGAFGDAGALTTNDENLDQRVRMLRNYGSSRKYYNERIGYNARLDECQAAFLSVKLKHLTAWTKMKGIIAAQYASLLSGLGDLVLPETAVGATHVYHIFMIRTKHRDHLKEYLEQNNVETLIHYPRPPHLQQALKHLGYLPGDFPVAEEIAGTCLSLPIYPGLSESQVEFVGGHVRDFFNKAVYKN